MLSQLKRTAVVALTVVMSLSMGACGPNDNQSQISGGPTIAVGLSLDIPGIGLEHEGRYSGFDVEIAKYVAHKLGYSDKQIVFKNIEPSVRVDALNHNVVDILVSPLQQNIAKVHETSAAASNDFEFAGPALTTRQGFLAFADAIDSFKDGSLLSGKRVCTVSGLGDEAAITSMSPGVGIIEFSNYGQCLTALMSSEVDAMSADVAALKGFSSQVPDERLSVSELDGSGIEHGIWTRAGTTRLKEKIRGILSDMVSEGAWNDAVSHMEKSTGFRPEGKPNLTTRQ
ncbi:transporter substrate-binding domain-containing protein [Bifidobacterium bombi]|uniref:ABC transporter, substrate-binding protein n=1 Tax=Bifidobacterium bombi DSM 19703 TaxID=1341695 RepID=A0A080N2A5_9BIFI|nr:transporter substrate-binding domain-containing protein [Bifidobacterium bombi]KFF31088.1 ABC transporter, substrate-binding protein [Bifidobacterium bombi DSM 19703]